MKTYQAAIFDLDATLVDNAASFRIAYLRLCELYPEVFKDSDESTREAVIHLYYIPKDQRCKSYLEICRKIGWGTAPDFCQFWNLWLDDLYVRSTVPFPWTHTVLSYLKERGIALGLITNGSKQIQTIKIQTAHLSEYFTSILISGAIGIKKPDPNIFWLSATQLSVPVDRCLFIGDNPDVDIAGAIGAGMDSLLIGKEEDPYGATYHAKTTEFLINLIK